MRLPFVICAIMAASAAAFPQDAQSGYSLEEVLSTAARKGPRIEIIDLEARAQRTQIDIYRSEAFPAISLSSGASYVSQSTRGLGIQGGSEVASLFRRIDGFLLNWALSGRQPLFSFGKVSNSLKLARLGEREMRASKRLQQDLYYLELIGQFTEAYLAQADRDAAHSAVVRTDRLLATLRADYESGRAAVGDLLNIEALALSDRAAHLSAVSTFVSARQRLATMAGIDDTSFSLHLDQSAPPPLFKGERRESAELELRRLERDVSDHQARYVRAGMFPSLSLTAGITNQFLVVDTTGMTERVRGFMEGQDEAGVAGAIPENPPPGSYFDPGFFNYSVGLQLDWQIFSGNRIRSQYRQALLNRERLDRELALLREENETALAESRRQIEVLDSMRAAGSLRVRATLRAVEQAQRDLGAGYIDAIDYLDAERELRSAERQVASATAGRIVAAARLRLESGLPVYTWESPPQ